MVSDRTDIGVAGVVQNGIQVELRTYLNLPTLAAERMAKHVLMVDVVRLAERCGPSLGLRILSAEQAPTVTEA